MKFETSLIILQLYNVTRLPNVSTDLNELVKHVSAELEEVNQCVNVCLLTLGTVNSQSLSFFIIYCTLCRSSVEND